MDIISFGNTNYQYICDLFSILRLEFNQLHLEDYTQLDGVLLEGTLKYNANEVVSNKTKNYISNIDRDLENEYLKKGYVMKLI